MSSKLLVYGATGFVGGHIARTAAGSGLPTILAGRDPAKLDPLAAELGVERRAFGLADPGAIETALKGVTVVLNCAGPFIAHGRTAGGRVPQRRRSLSRHHRRNPGLRGASREGRRSEGPWRHAASRRRLRRRRDRLPGAAPQAAAAVGDPLEACVSVNRAGGPPSWDAADGDRTYELRRSGSPQRQAGPSGSAAGDFGRFRPRAGRSGADSVGRHVHRLFTAPAFPTSRFTSPPRRRSGASSPSREPSRRRWNGGRCAICC